jgi:hypothetical protein
MSNILFQETIPNTKCQYMSGKQLSDILKYNMTLYVNEEKQSNNSLTKEYLSHCLENDYVPDIYKNNPINVNFRNGIQSKYIFMGYLVHSNNKIYCCREGATCFDIDPLNIKLAQRLGLDINPTSVENTLKNIKRPNLKCPKYKYNPNNYIIN